MQQTVNYFFYLFVALVVAGLLYLLSPILTPFLVGILLAYLADPLVNRLMRLHLPRLLSVLIVFISLFVIIALLIILLIPLIEKQIAALIIFIPKIIAWVQEIIIPWVSTQFGVQEIFNIDTIKTTLADNWMKAGDIASIILKTTLKSGFKFAAWITNLILVPVVTFYLLRDWDEVVQGFRNLLPRTIEPTVTKLAGECNEVLSAFFRGQLLVMLSLGIIYSIGLTLVGLQIGLMIGIISGLVSIVPYLGFIIGITTASIAAYIQFGSVIPIVWVCLVFVIAQTIDGMFLTPNLVGDRIGLHPVAVIFALLAGASLFGFFGVLLALPVAAVIMVLLRFVNQKYRHSRLYQK